MSYTDINKFWMSYQTGIQIMDPTKYIEIEYIHPKTKKVKEFNPKWRKAYLLWSALIMALIVEVVGVLSLAIWGLHMINTPLMLGAVCYTGFQMVRLLWVITWELHNDIPSRKKIITKYIEYYD